MNNESKESKGASQPVGTVNEISRNAAKKGRCLRSGLRDEQEKATKWMRGGKRAPDSGIRVGQSDRLMRKRALV